MIYILCVLMCTATITQAVTLVYNLRVRRTFNAPIVLEQFSQSRVLLSAVPIFSSRTSHIINERTGANVCEKRRAGGSIFNARYVPSKYWWLEATTGVETDHATFRGNDGFHASRAGLDDLVFTGGCRHFIGESTQLVGYGLLGVPTKWNITRCDRYTPLLGTRLFNIGFGAEASYSFLHELKRSCAVVVQYRLIHGFNRDWFPILPEGSRIQPGNVHDVLLTLRYRKKLSLFEAGYNTTIFANQAIILPTEKIYADRISRHGGYGLVSHGWLDLFWGKPFICGAGININRSNQLDARATTVWLYGAIVF